MVVSAVLRRRADRGRPDEKRRRVGDEPFVIDGAGPVQTLFRVVFPMLRPVTATVVILTSVAIWNEFALSVFILRQPEMRTIAPTISTFVSSQGGNLGAAAAEK
ncbi:ABC transporter permease subunit [uncultured Microbacterium sp.]|uniref:ABC transporter permease subunit n=1 Tax=uncultured Microbacterium sp. TaxID=191216 RepID=UPI00261BDA04|nr:ABC transporter permease subunit [uncultured Microbacterium sp.]